MSKDIQRFEKGWKKFLESERNRLYDLSQDAFEWLKTHENEKSKTKDLIHQTFILSTNKLNDVLSELYLIDLRKSNDKGSNQRKN